MELLNGFFTGILVQLISQPLHPLQTFWIAVTVFIVNPVIDEATVPIMECTLEFRYGWNNQLLIYSSTGVAYKGAQWERPIGGIVGCAGSKGSGTGNIGRHR
jgi:hypothetical protein